MRSIALGLGIEESYFDDKNHEQYHNLRLLSYPSIKSEIIRKDGQSRAGAHSGGPYYHHIKAMSDNSIDYGTLTLLFQDNVFAILPLALIISNAHEK